MKIPHTIPSLILRFYTKDHTEESLEAQYKGRLLKSEDFSWDESIESFKKTLANQCLEQIITDFVSFVELVDELNRVGRIRHETERARWAENLANYQEKKNEYDQRIATLSEKEKRKLMRSSIDDTTDDTDDSKSKIDVELPTPVPDKYPQFMPLNSVLDLLNGTDRVRVVEELDFKSIPLPIAIRQIPDEHYWERASVDRWPMVFVSEHGNSWRRLYMELNIIDEIENFHPYEGDMDKLIGELNQVSQFVSNISISNLIPSCYGMLEKGADFSAFHHDDEMINKDVDEGFQTGTDAIKLGLDKPLTKEYEEIEDEPVPGEEEADEAEKVPVFKGRDNSHLDFSQCLHHLKNLVKLSLVYEMADIGMDWEKKYFEFTDVDCENLAKALSQCPTLEIFEFNRSQMTGEQCKVLVKNGLILMPRLKSLNLSYQKLGNSGARAIARLITDQGSKVPKTLQSLFLARNQIKNKGAKALAFALTLNNHLCRLDLRLNLIRDSGGRDFGHALVKNRSLLCLNLAANRLTDKSAYVLGKMLFHNVALKEVDLSSNDFGKNGGQYLALGVRGNQHILKVDLRLTNIGLGFEYDVSQNTKKNIARAKISILEKNLYDLKSPGPSPAAPDTGASTHTGDSHSSSHKSAQVANS